jgi:hypothetical protein
VELTSIFDDLINDDTLNTNKITLLSNVSSNLQNQIYKLSNEIVKLEASLSNGGGGGSGSGSDLDSLVYQNYEDILELVYIVLFVTKIWCMDGSDAFRICIPPPFIASGYFPPACVCIPSEDKVSPRCIVRF